MSLSANIVVLKCHVTYLSALLKNENRPCNHEICFLHPMNHGKLYLKCYKHEVCLLHHAFMFHES
jgi:hypothetical protein